MQYLKQSTAGQLIMFGPFVDKTDGVTLKTDATTITDIDHGTTGIFLSKAGAAAAIRHAAVTASVADAYGMMKVTLDATDTATVGTLDVLFAKAATYLPVHKSFMVLPANVYDSLMGTDLLDVSLVQVAGSTTNVSALATNVDAILTDTATIDTAGEIAAAVWSADATTYQTQGTFGQAIGDPAADAGTIYATVVTNAAGVDIAADIVAMKVDTAAILVDTATIDTAGEIAAAVWSADATTYQTQGTFGQAIGDPAADANSIFKAVVTDATAATVGLDVVAALAVIGTPTDLGNGIVTIAGNIADVDEEVDATLAAVQGIAVTGAALNQLAGVGSVVTSGTETLDYTATYFDNGSYHIITGATISYLYVFTLPNATAIPVSFKVVGYLSRTAGGVNAGTIKCEVLNWPATWEAVDPAVFVEQTSTTDVVLIHALFAKYVEAGTGKVHIRFTNGSVALKDASSALHVDQIFVSYAEAVSANISLILQDTSELQTDWTNAGRLDTILDDILTDTAVIGAAGAGLTAVRLANGAHGGAAATLTLKSMALSNADAGGIALNIEGVGTGNSHAIRLNSTAGKALAIGAAGDAVTIDSSAAKGLVVNGATADIDADIMGNLNTKLDTIDDYVDTEVAAILAAVDTEVAAIKTKTDALPDGITKNAILANFMFFMADSADHVTGKTGLTPTATRSLDGGAFGACANAAAEVANGWYKITLAAADTNADIVALKFTSAGADATNIAFKTEA